MKMKMWKEKKSVIKKRRRINLYTGKVSWVISITLWGVGRGVLS